MDKSEAKTRFGSSLRWVINEKKISDEELSAWWGVQVDTVNKIKYGHRMATVDKVYVLHEMTATPFNQIFLGENAAAEEVNKTIEFYKNAYPGHIEIAIPEIIIELSKQIPEMDRDEAYRRLTQYFALKIY